MEKKLKMVKMVILVEDGDFGIFKKSSAVFTFCKTSSSEWILFRFEGGAGRTYPLS